MTNITREQIIEALVKKGYSAQANDTIKNGCVLSAITIRNGSNIAPNIYIDAMLEHFDSLEDIVENIINIYEAHKSVDIDISLFSNHDWILDHLYIALQKSSTENLIKRTCEFDGIEQYLYIRGSVEEDGWSVKLNAGIMENASLSLTEVWDAATRNTFAAGETIIKSMTSVLAEMLGEPICEDFDLSMPKMYVITNKSKTKGSVQILDKKTIRSYFPSNVHRLVCIPSSIHEFILVPFENISDINIDDFNVMVQEVNASEVDATEQLGSHIYILSI